MQTPRLKEHEFKCWPAYFAAHSTGHKNFEIRGTSDRDFRVGDILVLREFEPSNGTYTGRSLKRLVTYITSFGQPEEQVVMGLTEWRGVDASGRPCPSAERVLEIADLLYRNCSYTQAQEVEALGAELQKTREVREGLLQEIRALRAERVGSSTDSKSE